MTIFFCIFVRRDARQHDEGNTCIIDSFTFVIFRHEQRKQKHMGRVRVNLDMQNKCPYGRETEGGHFPWLLAKLLSSN